MCSSAPSVAAADVLGDTRSITQTLGELSGTEVFRACAVQVSQATGEADDPYSIRRCHRAYVCPHCNTDLYNDFAEGRFIVGITPFHGVRLSDDPAINVGYVTQRCPNCHKGASSLMRSDNYRVLVALGVVGVLY
jgi:Zn finger protein HypA/HybF involved in hydrogenase expression